MSCNAGDSKIQVVVGGGHVWCFRNGGKWQGLSWTNPAIVTCFLAASTTRGGNRGQNQEELQTKDEWRGGGEEGVFGANKYLCPTCANCKNRPF